MFRLEFAVDVAVDEAKTNRLAAVAKVEWRGGGCGRVIRCWGFLEIWMERKWLL